jgi:prophage regulatory protein
VGSFIAQDESGSASVDNSETDRHKVRSSLRREVSPVSKGADVSASPTEHARPERVLDAFARLPHQIKRTVRRPELRKIVPLADTTIYEMEKRGEFPRRFNLTPRCVVWDLAEVEAWIEDRQRTSYAAGATRAPSPDVRQRKTRPVRR